MRAQQIVELFSILSASNPLPKSELAFDTPFTFLICVVLSAQATDKSVNKATQVLFKVARTPNDMIKLGQTKLQSYIKEVGLSNAKSHNIIKLCHQILNDFEGRVPDSRKGLESLAGVGPKTAGVVLNVVFGQSTVAVDTHVFRVANRTGLAPGKTPALVEAGLMRVIPNEYLKNAHHWLILHGRYVCQARKPLCDKCLIRHLCQYDQNQK